MLVLLMPGLSPWLGLWQGKAAGSCDSQVCCLLCKLTLKDGGCKCGGKSGARLSCSRSVPEVPVQTPPSDLRGVLTVAPELWSLPDGELRFAVPPASRPASNALRPPTPPPRFHA